MSADNVFDRDSMVKISDSAKKAILAQLPSRAFDGTGDDYLREIENQYVLKATFQTGIWPVRIDVSQYGQIIVRVEKPVEKRGFIRRMMGEYGG